jgi:DNA-binding CsgD family transcriptional regulator
MTEHDECRRCRVLELRCAELERQLAEARRRLERLARPLAKGRESLPQLTTREVEVLELIARGLSTDEIGEELYLSRNSVKTHTRKLYKKLGVSNRTEAAIWALNRPPTDSGAPASPDGGGRVSPMGLGHRSADGHGAPSRDGHGARVSDQEAVP